MRRRSESGLWKAGPATRERLDRLNDLFAWLYDKSSDPAVIRRRFYLVLFRLTEGEIRRWDPRSLERFAEVTQRWDWLAFRAKVKRQVEQLINSARDGKAFPLPHLRRTFGLWDIGGGIAFGVALQPRWRLRDGGLAEVILLEAAEDLAGFDANTVVRCAVCHAFTIRQRAKAKEYCSSACRWQAITEERRAARQAAKSVEKGK